MVSMVLKMNTWLNPEKRQNIIVAGEHGEGLFTLWCLGSREKKRGVMTKYTLGRHIPADLCVQNRLCL